MHWLELVSLSILIEFAPDIDLDNVRERLKPKITIHLMFLQQYHLGQGVLEGHLFPLASSANVVDPA